MHDLDNIAERIAGLTILCVGDVMLDEFVYGDITRISPEAPVPVITAAHSEKALGGAGNVSRNIAALGARCIFAGVIGSDAAGREIAALFAAEDRIVPHLVVESGRQTTRKTRFVSRQHAAHVLRADWENAKPLSDKTERALLARICDAIPLVDAVVLSDYAKGVLTIGVVEALITAARALDKPVIVDPKQSDFASYFDATIVTPNRIELSQAVGRPLAGDADIASACAQVLDIGSCQAVIATRGDEGMTLLVRGGEALHIPAHKVAGADVSGAGDTVAAAVAVMLAAGEDFTIAARVANAAGAAAVGKRGTAAVSFAELRSLIEPAAGSKVIFDWNDLDRYLDDWRRQGLKIGFTNGCFDLLHPGHLKVLSEARAACDRLVVGLNGDISVRRLKGHGRPLQSEQDRARMLAALGVVDLVAVFTQDTPLELIERIRPQVLVKGGDYRACDVIGGDVVRQNGGQVIIVDLAPGYSTTAVISRMPKLERGHAAHSL